jgi:hypothetical protein
LGLSEPEVPDGDTPEDAGSEEGAASPGSQRSDREMTDALESIGAEDGSDAEMPDVDDTNDHATEDENAHSENDHDGPPPRLFSPARNVVDLISDSSDVEMDVDERPPTRSTRKRGRADSVQTIDSSPPHARPAQRRRVMLPNTPTPVPIVSRRRAEPVTRPAPATRPASRAPTSTPGAANTGRAQVPYILVPNLRRSELDTYVRLDISPETPASLPQARTRTSEAGPSRIDLSSSGNMTRNHSNINSDVSSNIHSRSRTATDVETREVESLLAQRDRTPATAPRCGRTFARKVTTMGHYHGALVPRYV